MRNSNNMPILSIITVTYNSVQEIRETIQSVVQFVCGDIEYIVIDGNSNDGTLELLKEYESAISVLISEPDKGIYDAMNKGLRYASGKWAIFINCGDKLLNIPHEIFDCNNLCYSCIAAPVIVDFHKTLKPEYNWTLKIRNSLPHQGLFYNLTKGSVAFDLKYKIFSDYDLNLQLYKNKAQILIISTVVSYHSLIGVSNNKKVATKELFSLIKTHSGFFYMIISWFYFKIDGLRKRIYE